MLLFPIRKKYLIIFSYFSIPNISSYLPSINTKTYMVFISFVRVHESFQILWTNWFSEHSKNLRN